MVDTKLLKLKLRERNMTQEDVARELGIDPSTFNRKINNKFGDNITVKEAELLSDILKIPRSKLSAIFFAKELAETQENKKS
mgnify:CR=1 FL=1